MFGALSVEPVTCRVYTCAFYKQTPCLSWRHELTYVKPLETSPRVSKNTSNSKQTDTATSTSILIIQRLRLTLHRHPRSQLQQPLLLLHLAAHLPAYSQVLSFLSELETKRP